MSEKKKKSYNDSGKNYSYPNRDPNDKTFKKQINWSKVEFALTRYCTIAEVATSLGIGRATLVNRFEFEKPFDTDERQFKTIGDFKAYCREGGNSIIRLAQWESIERAEPSETMLIWLGKQYLKQVSEPAIKIEQNSDEGIQRVFIGDSSQAVDIFEDKVKTEDKPDAEN
ncbi:MAG: hypothetical protein HRT61_00830 [Ekhidna sp.]|nr:hypothetical protein [Ekhidna sp.]